MRIKFYHSEKKRCDRCREQIKRSLCVKCRANSRKQQVTGDNREVSIIQVHDGPLQMKSSFDDHQEKFADRTENSSRSRKNWFNLDNSLPDSFYENFSCWTYWFLLLLYFSYLFFGAYMFMQLERPVEEQKCEFVNEFGRLYLVAGEEMVWQTFGRNMTELQEMKPKDNITMTKEMYNELLKTVKSGAVDHADMISDGCTNKWSFLSSYYFVGTVVTTLGYGNVYPSTNPGKVFCICYAMIGVPLFYYIMKRTSDFLLEKFKELERKVAKTTARFASAIALLVYVVGGFIFCSLIPAVVFHHIEGWTLLEAWYFTMITLLTIGFGDYCPTSDYIRYKEQHRQDRDVSNDHEHNQIGQIYFDFYRVTVYIWTLLGLSWLGGLISLIVDSASKVSLQKRVDMDDYNAGRFCIDCREIECDTHYGHPNLYTHT